MSESSQEVWAPDEFRLVNDPETGAQDAVLEIWSLGEHSQAAADIVHQITELNGGTFGQAPKRDNNGMTKQSLLTMLSLRPALPDAPKVSQFIAVGEERSCAIRVSYRNPYDTHPMSHPGVHAAIGELVGSQYITIKHRILELPG